MAEITNKFLPASNLKILITDNDSISFENGMFGNVKVLKWKYIEKELELKKHLLSSYFSLEDVGGYFLDVDDKYVERIVAKSTHGIKYHIFNGQGGFLQPGARIFFYSPGLTAIRDEGVWGIGLLSDITLGKKNEEVEMYDLNDDFNLYSKEEYDVFSNFTDEEDIVLLHIENIQIIQPAVKINANCFSPKFQEYIREREDSEWYRTHWFDSYLDFGSINFLTERIESLKQKEYPIFPSKEPIINAGKAISQVLFFTAAPQDMNGISDFGWTGLFHKIKGVHPNIVIRQLEKTTLTRLVGFLLQNADADVVHFHGHSEKDGIYLLDTNAEDKFERKKLHVSDFGNWLQKRCPALQLLFFTSCFSSSLAEVLSKTYKYVLALNGEVTEEIGIRLFKCFYNSILAESSIEDILITTCQEYIDNRKFLESHLSLWKDGQEIAYKMLLNI